MTRTRQITLTVGVAMLLVVAFLVAQNWALLRAVVNQPQMFREPVLDHKPVTLREEMGAVPILSFSKTNWYRHHDSIVAATNMLDELAEANGWTIYHTENGGVFTAANLARFRLLILNHKSGTVWTAEQRQAVRRYVEDGGTILAYHAAGGDNTYAWDWYINELLRAQFVDHPMTKHIQQATLVVEDHTHPATQHLPAAWIRSDEWYNFVASPRDRVNVLISIDESTYDPEQSPMGDDHPMVWWHTVGAGRIFYSALGHTPETYQEPAFRQFMQAAITWGLDRNAVPTNATANR